MSINKSNNNSNVVEISLEDIGHVENKAQAPRKKPPKLVYCGDGILEEYSDEEENEEEKRKEELEAASKETIDTVSMKFSLRCD